jgi:hypothetical protein
MSFQIQNENVNVNVNNTTTTNTTTNNHHHHHHNTDAAAGAAEEAEFSVVDCDGQREQDVLELEPPFRLLACECRSMHSMMKYQEEPEQEPAAEQEEEKTEDHNNHNQRQEFIFTYPDGSNYMGQMQNELKHGKGTLRTAAFIYGGEHTTAYTSEAEENGRLATWNEYIGLWENDKMHGYGSHIRKFGDGSEIIIFEGEWINGVAQEEDPYWANCGVAAQDEDDTLYY